MDGVDEANALEALHVSYRGLLDALDGIDDEAGWRPTGCAGWCVRDLIWHLISDAQRALVALHSPTSKDADTDSISYWRSWQPGTAGADAGRRGTRIMASAWSSVEPMAALYAETAQAAMRAAAAADEDTIVITQGHALARDDLLRTLAVEAVIHHVDLIAQWDRPGPHPLGLALVRSTLDGLASAPAPQDIDDLRYLLIGTGRAQPTAAERELLGATAEQLPLFG